MNTPALDMLLELENLRIENESGLGVAYLKRVLDNLDKNTIGGRIKPANESLDKRMEKIRKLLKNGK